MLMNIMLSMSLILMFLMIMSNNFKHLILTLMSIEYLMMTMILYLYYLINIYNNEWMLMILIIFIVAESIVGLSIMLMMSRQSGNDMIKSLNMSKW